MPLQRDLRPPVSLSSRPSFVFRNMIVSHILLARRINARDAVDYREAVIG